MVHQVHLGNKALVANKERAVFKDLQGRQERRAKLVIVVLTESKASKANVAMQGKKEDLERQEHLVLVVLVVRLAFQVLRVLVVPREARELVFQDLQVAVAPVGFLVCRDQQEGREKRVKMVGTERVEIRV